MIPSPGHGGLHDVLGTVGRGSRIRSYAQSVQTNGRSRARTRRRRSGLCEQNSDLSAFSFHAFPPRVETPDVNTFPNVQRPSQRQLLGRFSVEGMTRGCQGPWIAGTDEAGRYYWCGIILGPSKRHPVGFQDRVDRFVRRRRYGVLRPRATILLASHFVVAKVRRGMTSPEI